MLLTLNTMQAEEALSRAVESCRYNRDPRSLELAITRAIHDGVSADLIANAKRTLAELDSSHMTRNKALAALDQAVHQRPLVPYSDAISCVTPSRIWERLAIVQGNAFHSAKMSARVPSS